MLMIAVDTVLMKLRVKVEMISSRWHDDHGPSFEKLEGAGRGTKILQNVMAEDGYYLGG